MAAVDMGSALLLVWEGWDGSSSLSERATADCDGHEKNQNRDCVRHTEITSLLLNWDSLQRACAFVLVYEPGINFAQM